MRKIAAATVVLVVTSSLGFARYSASTPSRAALDDATIVAIFDAANTADIETGNLGAERGSTKEVRDFGAMLARDHKAVVKRLSALRGSAFDHAFLQHEVAFHKGVIDAVNTTFMPAIQNAELK